MPAEESLSYKYLLWQTNHHHALVYGASPSTKADEFRKKIIDPTKNSTIDLLAQNGVGYMIIHADIYQNSQAWKYPAEYNNGIVPEITDPRATLVECIDQKCLYKINQE